MANVKSERLLQDEEIVLEARNGMPVLVLNVCLMVGSIALFVWSFVVLGTGNLGLGLVLMISSLVYLLVVGPTLFFGLKVLQPNEALVLTLFGRYYGTLRGAGYYFVNPFVSAVNTATADTSTGGLAADHAKATAAMGQVQIAAYAPRSKKISLKAMTLNNDKQKINDQLGNPIVIGIVVIWRVVNTAKAVFNVDNYVEFLSIQCDSALRNIVRLYPYDNSGDDNEKSLRGSSQEVAEVLKAEIQEKVGIAGIEILEARITHLAYAPEIAAAMLQRQQAKAVVDARQLIVEGAVGMVEMALAKLNEKNVVTLDEERKAAMVSNLLVVLCGNRDAQPVVNSGSLY